MSPAKNTKLNNFYILESHLQIQTTQTANFLLIVIFRLKKFYKKISLVFYQKITKFPLNCHFYSIPYGFMAKTILFFTFLSFIMLQAL
jgi:hypothetical protein